MVLNVKMLSCCWDMRAPVRSISVASDSKALWELDNLQGEMCKIVKVYTKTHAPGDNG